MKQFVLYVFALLAISSCEQKSGSGNIVTEKRKTGDFKGISAGGAFEVEVKNGPVTEVVVEADDNIIGLIETEVNGDELKIRIKDGVHFNNAHFKVFVTAPEINSVKSSGASDVTINDEIKSNGKVSFDVSGAGKISGAVDAPEVEVEISGAGKIELSGKTRDYKAEISGSGELATENLQTENTDVRVSGAGSAKVHASVTLKAHASGAGNIFYRGEAKVEQHSSGAGNVKKED